MATDLGTAYIQIMPSAKGISGSIKGVLDPEAMSAGKSAGNKIGSRMLNSMNKIGGKLTKSITVPVAGATSVVGGLVSALGFKRLTGMDNARAKLEGLGIEGKQLEIVMQNARDAVQGTTHTMAEGADVAAGALAAGVKEGAELERYIKLVGDAATGSNAPMSELAQIFNRVQGTGKLMGDELNMIEHRMPGFSQALAKHLGVAPEEMRKMVSAGKVTSADFLDTMEGFAGGMSEAYAKTWSGLKDNVMANIGIIGEALLEGLFEEGKEGMADFLDFLRNSDGLKEWATETGEKLREVFKGIVSAIKTLAEWWSGLSDTAKGFIKVAGAIAVAIGPVLTAITKLIGVFTKVKWIIGVVKPVILTIGGIIGGISAPVWIVIGAITALVAAGVALWKNWDSVKEFAGNLWDNLVTGFTFVKDKVVEFFTVTIPEAFRGFIEGWKLGYETLKEIIVTFFTETVPEQFNKFIEFITELPGKVMGFLNQLFLEDIHYAVGYGIGFLVEKASEGITNTIEFFRELPGKVKEFVTTTIENVTQFAINLKNKAIEAGKEFLTNVVNYVKELPGRIKEFVTTIITSVVEWRNQMRQRAIEAGTNFLNNVVNFVKQLPGRIKEFLSNIIKNITEFAKNAKNKALEAGKNIFDSIVDTVKKIPGQMLSLGKDIITGLINGVKNSIGSVVGIAKDIAGNFVGGFKSAMGIQSPSTVMIKMMGHVMDALGIGVEKGEDSILGKAKKFIGNLTDVFNKEFTFDFGANESVLSRLKSRAINATATIVGNGPELATAGGHQVPDETNVNITIQEMNVRNDEDINRVSRELQRIIDKNRRGRGY